MNNDLGRDLSPLELTVLGVVMKKGPCNGNSVLQEFTHSQTAYYSSGAGSIYPVLKRLERAGLISRQGKKLQLTEGGLLALRQWFTDPDLADDVSCSLDLIRSRMYFMRILSTTERLSFVDRISARLKELLIACEAKVQAYREAGDPFSTLAMEGAVEETKARIAWLERVKATLPP
jgi:DNA-binding PadR family transcriptional regulator